MGARLTAAAFSRSCAGIDTLVQKLHTCGKTVYLVSGGFRQMIAPVAAKLNIPNERIYANNLLFNAQGEYAGFDRTEPTSRSGGKARVIQMLREKFHPTGPIVMVGDGATDMEARPPANLFIGFGGVVVRESVRNGADWFAMSMQELVSGLDAAPPKH